MNKMSLISFSLVMIGVAFLLISILRGTKLRLNVPEELQLKWRIMMTLMAFFLIGYVLFAVVLIASLVLPTELITGMVFIGGALFVFIVVGLTGMTIDKIKASQEELVLINESLDRRVAERTEELKLSQEFLKTVLDSLHDEVIIISAEDFRIEGANKAFLRRYGLSAEGLIGKRCHEVAHRSGKPCDEPGSCCAIKALVEKGVLGRAEHVHYDAEGGKMYEEISAFPIKDESGKVFRIVHVSRDITERKRSEDALRQLNETLELKIEERTKQLLDTHEELVRKEKLATLGQLAGSVGHELRNPLGVMNNAVYYLKTVMSDADETVREYLDMIKSEIDNSLRIITDLLDFSRVKTPQTQSTSINELIQQSLGKCTVPDNITLRLDMPDTLPAINVDPLHMEQIFKNLIINAVQAMPPEGGELRITARRIQDSKFKIQDAEKNIEYGVLNFELDRDFIEISVADTGEGISPENMKKLFQPLFTTKAKGIGLGLVVCKNLVEANSGKIEVESELGKGTTFTVVLKVVQ